MRKLIIALTLTAFTAVLFSSCKSHERCPAYGKVEQKVNQNQSV